MKAIIIVAFANIMLNYKKFFYHEGFHLIRVENFVFGHVADEGWMNAGAGPLLRYRKMIGAEKIAVFADIKKKHRLIFLIKKIFSG